MPKRTTLRSDHGVNWLPPSTITDSKRDDLMSRREHWLNPIARVQLRAACEKRAKNVILNGKKFVIRYGLKWVSAYDGDHEIIYIKPADGSLVPMGYLRLDKVLRYDMEEDE